MDIIFYYKDTDKVLRCLGVSDITSVQDARQVVLEHLHETKERYYEPILGVVK